jgi:hypothetical protein
MKRALIAAFLLLGLSAPVLASPLVVTGTAWIPQRQDGHLDRSRLMERVGARSYTISASGNEAWFAVVNRHRKVAGFEQFYTSPGGSPMVADVSTLVPDISEDIAATGDIVGAGTAPMRYDSSADLYVTLANAGSIVISGTVNLSGGTAAIGHLNSANGYSSQNINPTNFTSGCSSFPCLNTLVTGATTIYGFVFLSGTAMVAGQTMSCYDNATTNSGTILLQAAQMGSDQVITVPGGANGLTVSNGVTCALAGTALTSTQFFEVQTNP